MRPFKDVTSITVIKIQRLFEDKNLSNKELRQKTKEILIEYSNYKDEVKSNHIKKLQEEVEKFRTVKKLLSV